MESKLLFLLVLIVFLVGCTTGQVTKIPVCNKPYILIGYECCLDKNDNSICDKDENIQSTKSLDETTKETISKETTKKEEPKSTEPLEEKVLAKPTTFTVSRIIDGDTFVLNTGEKLRLIGIDTPESYEDYYQEATDRLEELVLGKEVTLEKDISETDKYGRLLRYVYVDGKFVNKIMVEEGWAEAYPYEPDTKYKTEFANAESIAKSNNLGIWKVEEEEEEQETKKTIDSGYICSYNAYNCDDFSTHSQAQAVYELCGGVSNDIHRLDRDKDGLACESLP